MPGELERLRERVRKDPFSRLFISLADRLGKAGMRAEAIQVLLDGIERHPDYMSAHVALGKLYIEEDNIEGALSEFRRVADAIPDNLFAQRRLADIYLLQGDREGARKALEMVVRLNPMDSQAKEALEKLSAASATNPFLPIPLGPSPSPSSGDGISAPSESDFGSEGAPVKQPDEGLDAWFERAAQIGVDAAGASYSLPPVPLPGDEAKTPDAADGKDTSAGDTSAVDGGEAASETEAVPEDMFEFEDSAAAIDPMAIDPMTGADEAGQDAQGGKADDRAGWAGAVDSMIGEGEYGEAFVHLRRRLEGHPDDIDALQRLEELKTLVKLLGLEDDVRVSLLGAFLESARRKKEKR